MPATRKAGTGKTTTIKFIVEALGLDQEDVCYVAFTGKAASVLKTKNCPNATTAHKLLYYAKPRKNGTYFFLPKPTEEIPYRLIVVDEVSMLPLSLWRQLLRHKIPVIALGDPGQLPAVSSDEDNYVLYRPHIFLDEIMRQSLDSEIIRLSMWIREGKPIAQFPFQKEQVILLPSKELSMDHLNWADQVLCATNTTRHALNDQMRIAKGFGPKPQIGDKIIGLNNHWDFCSDSGEWSLTNGCIGTITDFFLRSERMPPKAKRRKKVEYLYTDMVFDNEKFTSIPIDYQGLITGEKTLTPQQEYILRKDKETDLEPPYHFAYGYAITVWKAQGSEWPKVLGVEERFPNDLIERRKFLYTLCTRASEKLVLVLKDN